MALLFITYKIDMINCRDVEKLNSQFSTISFNSMNEFYKKFGKRKRNLLHSVFRDTKTKKPLSDSASSIRTPANNSKTKKMSGCDSLTVNLNWKNFSNVCLAKISLSHFFIDQVWLKEMVSPLDKINYIHSVWRGGLIEELTVNLPCFKGLTKTVLELKNNLNYRK